jgi:hypothetical protein
MMLPTPDTLRERLYALLEQLDAAAAREPHCYPDPERIGHAAAIVTLGAVRRLCPGRWAVRDLGGGLEYRVFSLERTCTCGHAGGPCVHLTAIDLLLYLEGEAPRKGAP